MTKLESKISSVTVYKDRAMVKRNALIKTEKGEYSYSFENLPNNIEQNSIQVNGTKGMILNDIKFEKQFIEEFPESDKKSLLLNKKNIEEEIGEVNDKVNQSTKEKQFVEGIIAKIIVPDTSENSTLELDPEKWMKMVSFYRAKMENIDKEIREAKKEIEKLNEKLKSIIHNLKKYDSPEYKINNCVNVKIESTESGEKEIQLNYIVYGPSWVPVYDLRINSETKKLNLEYNAFVVQKTDEDWTDVKLLLSTAQAQISGNQPELNPWYVNFYVAPPAPVMMDKIKRSMKKIAPMAELAKCDTKEEECDEFDMLAADLKGMHKAPAKVETGSTAVIFNIHGKSLILSTGEKYKIGIMLKEFNADFKYSSVPKLIPYAFLKAKVKNESEFPLLPGESHIFFDGSFVTNSYLKLVAPNEEFWTSLGIDEGIKIDYKLINKFEKDEGIFSKKRKFIYEYKTEITNTKKTDEEVSLIDQIPISQNQEIVVELIEPKYKEDTEEIKKDDHQKITWKYLIKAGEKKIINFKFSVESPREKELAGL